jgi:hypothetical protein
MWSRRIFPRSRAVLATAMFAAGCGTAPPVAAPVRLIAGSDTVLTPYGDITDAAWLGGTRWVLIAPQDRAVTVASMDTKKVTPFAGARSKDLEQPFHLFRTGDSIYVADWQRRQLTSWSLDGKSGGAIPAADGLRGALPRTRDDQGRWYFELRAPPGLDGSGNQDSAAIVRTAPDLTGADTIARLAPLELAEVISDGRRRLERRLLSGQDRWGVLPDGSLWIARIGQNRVDWRDTTGTMHRGRELPDAVLPVTENDRQLFLRKFEPALRPTVSQIPFVVIKPPFENAFAAPDGTIWLVKNRAIGDTLRTYQWINRDGHLVGTASHPGFGRILAVGEGVALVGEPFEGGVRLLDFRIPAPAQTGAP